MDEPIRPEAVTPRSAAMSISPATLEDLERDLAMAGGLAYRFLSQVAGPILDGSRSPNPIPFDGLWAFDVYGFTFVTNIPYGRSKTLSEARDVLSSMLRRSLEVSGQKDSRGRPARAAAAAGNGVKFKGTTSADRSKKAASLYTYLKTSHYTAVPDWLLSNEIGLSASERILLSDAVDVLASGNVLSYEMNYLRLRSRSGLRPSTAARAARGLCRVGLLAPVRGCRGRYTLSWESLAQAARSTAPGKAALGAATVAADVRRRLSKPKHVFQLPVWAVEACGATEAAFLLAKAWSLCSGQTAGTLWASGETLSRWLPGCERSLRRARAALAERGFATMVPQYSYLRSYETGPAKNKTAEITVTPLAIARALLFCGYDFGGDAAALSGAIEGCDLVEASHDLKPSGSLGRPFAAAASSHDGRVINAGYTPICEAAPLDRGVPAPPPA